MNNSNKSDCKESIENMLASEKSLKKDWDNGLDRRWEDITI